MDLDPLGRQVALEEVVALFVHTEHRAPGDGLDRSAAVAEDEAALG